MFYFANCLGLVVGFPVYYSNIFDLLIQRRNELQYTGLKYIYLFLFISPLFNQVGKGRTSSHLQLRSGQEKAKQFDTYNDTELHME